MNRLCIYITYNRENKIYPYMEYMLKAMKSCVSKLYVVCNYPKILEGEEYLQTYADEVYFRENKGYDVGAYKDMLCTVLGWDELRRYDELVLMNDSFFGPFYTMESYFKTMEKEPCDFWGVTRSPEGKLDSLQYEYGTHIHSYFFVIRKKIIQSNDFYGFWRKLPYPKGFSETVRDFEIGINRYFKKKEYQDRALTDIWGMKFQYNENPYYLYSFEMIREHGMPFLKKKNLLIRNQGFQNTLSAIHYLEENNLYPTEWIWFVLDNQFHLDEDVLEGNSLERFLKKYRRIYIYGAGVCGKNLLLYFAHKGWQAEGLIVTDKNNQNVACLTLEEAQIDEETGIIISVIRPEVAEEIVKTIGTRCKREQLFLISDCASVRLPV